MGSLCLKLARDVFFKAQGVIEKIHLNIKISGRSSLKVGNLGISFSEALKEGYWVVALNYIRKQRDEGKRSALVDQFLRALEQRLERSPHFYREAIKILRPIHYLYETLKAYRALIEILIKLGVDIKSLLGRLKGLVNEKPSGFEKASYLAPLARLLIAYGFEKEGLAHFDLALKETEKIDRADTKAYTLSVIAYSMIQANLVDEALRVFRRADRTVRKSEYLFNLYNEKVRIARYLYSLGLKREGRKALIRAFLFLSDLWYEKEVRRYLWYIIEEFERLGEKDLQARATSLFRRLYY